ncbi:DUF3631 domain-containing protein [Marinactinospora rubrisoli]|uniref:DUF3631 domain-containing protein n=1 Tax=Marinactinospora rubrisoli TaxID=2715399 RepID=A0ABW2KAQ1_9ACTN
MNKTTEALAYRLDDLDQGDTLGGLLAELHAAFVRYVILPTNEDVDALTLWCAATHAQSVADHAPRLVIKAPEKRCGKSRCLDVVEAVSYRPIVAVNTTPAAIFRSIDPEQPPTLIFDEADTLFGSKHVAEQNEDLRGLLNAGHQRGRPVRRVVGQSANLEVAEFPTFAMAALAGIGSMPDTIEDRAVVITMRRRAPGETVAKYRYRRDQVPLYELRDRLTACVISHLGQLTDAEPNMPVEDRAADTWEPLIALADVAGGQWPDRARAAALALTRRQDAEGDEGSPRVRALADCRAVFAAHSDPHALKTAVLLKELCGLDDAPWAEWGKNGLTSRMLAQLLREYGITSTTIRFPEGPAKGYRRADFADAWTRYLSGSTEPPGVSAVPAVTPSFDQVNALREQSGNGLSRDPATKRNPVTSQNEHVTAVTDQALGPCLECGALIPRYGPQAIGSRCAECRPVGDRRAREQEE